MTEEIRYPLYEVPPPKEFNYKGERRLCLHRLESVVETTGFGHTYRRKSCSICGISWTEDYLTDDVLRLTEKVT